jgi:hypothetical protein
LSIPLTAFIYYIYIRVYLECCIKCNNSPLCINFTNLKHGCLKTFRQCRTYTCAACIHPFRHVPTSSAMYMHHRRDSHPATVQFHLVIDEKENNVWWSLWLAVFLSMGGVAPLNLKLNINGPQTHTNLAVVIAHYVLHPKKGPALSIANSERLPHEDVPCITLEDVIRNISADTIVLVCCHMKEHTRTLQTYSNRYKKSIIFFNSIDVPWRQCQPVVFNAVATYSLVPIELFDAFLVRIHNIITHVLWYLWYLWYFRMCGICGICCFHM